MSTHSIRHVRLICVLQQTVLNLCNVSCRSGGAMYKVHHEISLTRILFTVELGAPTESSATGRIF